MPTGMMNANVARDARVLELGHKAHTGVVKAREVEGIDLYDIANALVDVTHLFFLPMLLREVPNRYMS